MEVHSLTLPANETCSGLTNRSSCYLSLAEVSADERFCACVSILYAEPLMCDNRHVFTSPLLCSSPPSLPCSAGRAGCCCCHQNDNILLEVRAIAIALPHARHSPPPPTLTGLSPAAWLVQHQSLPQPSSRERSSTLRCTLECLHCI